MAEVRVHDDEIGSKAPPVTDECALEMPLCSVKSLVNRWCSFYKSLLGHVLSQPWAEVLGPKQGQEEERVAPRAGG